MFCSGLRGVFAYLEGVRRAGASYQAYMVQNRRERRMNVHAIHLHSNCPPVLRQPVCIVYYLGLQTEHEDNEPDKAFALPAHRRAVDA